MPNDETDRAKSLLVKMYLDLKMIKKEETEEINEERFSEEKLRIKKLSLIDLINYISKNLNMLVEIKANFKYEEKIKKEKENESEDDQNTKKSLAEQYEELLIKAENDIRKHIKVSIIFLI
jgi:hypothetical protein